MSQLRDGDILILKLARRIRGKLVEEQLKIEADDVKWLPTPQLLRLVVEQIDRAQARLEATEEFGGGEEGEADCIAESSGMYNCDCPRCRQRRLEARDDEQRSLFIPSED